jgi:CelD/BcsL family acetyltransferase involved in cellulose biosynthesis
MHRQRTVEGLTLREFKQVTVPPSGSRLRLGEAFEPVVRQRLPGGRISDVGMPAWSHAGVTVEGCHAHAHLRVVFRIATKKDALHILQLMGAAAGERRPASVEQCQLAAGYAA